MPAERDCQLTCEIASNIRHYSIRVMDRILHIYPTTFINTETHMSIGMVNRKLSCFSVRTKTFLSGP